MHVRADPCHVAGLPGPVPAVADISPNTIIIIIIIILIERQTRSPKAIDVTSHDVTS